MKIFYFYIGRRRKKWICPGFCFPRAPILAWKKISIWRCLQSFSFFISSEEKKAFLGRGGISNSARYKYVNNSKVASWLYMIDLIYVWVQPFCLKDNARIVNLDISMTWNVCWFNVSLMCLHFEYNRIILKSESISPGLSLQSCTLRPRLKTLERK